MISLLLLSTIWLPLIYSLPLLNHFIFSINGFINNNTFLIDSHPHNILPVYDHVEIKYWFKNNTYTLASTNFINWPPVYDSNNKWIYNAYLHDPDHDSILDITNTLLQYAGPFEDFHNHPFNVHWLFNSNSFSFLTICDYNFKVFTFNIDNYNMNSSACENLLHSHNISFVF